MSIVTKPEAITINTVMEGRAALSTAPDQPTRVDLVRARLRAYRAPPAHSGPASGEAAHIAQILGEFGRAYGEKLKHVEASAAQNVHERTASLQACEEKLQHIEAWVGQLLADQRRGRWRTRLAMFLAACSGVLVGAGLVAAGIATYWR